MSKFVFIVVLAALCACLALAKESKKEEKAMDDFSIIDDRMKKTVCLLGARNEYLKRKEEVAQVVKTFIADVTNEVIAKAFRKFVYALAFKCYKEIEGPDAKKFLMHVKEHMTYKDDDEIIPENDELKDYFALDISTIFDAEFELTVQERAFLKSIEEDTEGVTQEPIKIRSRKKKAAKAGSLGSSGGDFLAFFKELDTPTLLGIAASGVMGCLLVIRACFGGKGNAAEEAPKTEEKEKEKKGKKGDKKNR